ncbi:protein FAR-RED ELONGATED HYPOCOTYL 3 [Prunus persica]|uniref:protein FAR-RED ELONGATED HYPOCOTYL 3 n=1 Tax=Prunus persica TaxID=3760 RepID=UPI0009AB28A7|nr:protein FAR-RED ELONGATED HYPOCOTYL 3 [Prunus persica]
MPVLLRKLFAHEYVEWHRSYGIANIVSDLFYAHPTSIKLLHAFPHILIMDCTYKTNRFRYPLLKIVGVTSTHLTFSIAFVYLSAEKEDNYRWALARLRSVMGDNSIPSVIVTDRELALMNALHEVFPGVRHLLCTWHINKGVLGKFKNVFEDKASPDKFLISWNMLVSSNTEAEYERHLLALQTNFKDHNSIINYVKETWLILYKERFVAAWTNTCMHFGNTTSNRAETAHAKLKKQLGNSMCTFGTSWDKIHPLIELQHNKIKASFEKSLSFVQHDCRKEDFKELIGFVSISALDNIMVELKRLDYIGVDSISCGCIIKHTHGLPCAHEMQEFKQTHRPIPLDCIHPRWRKLYFLEPRPIATSNNPPENAQLELFVKWFQSCSSETKRHFSMKLQEIMNPASTTLTQPQLKIKTKGRPKVDTSTQRLPSAFEVVLFGQDSAHSTDKVVTRPPRKKPKTIPQKRSVYRPKPIVDDSCLTPEFNKWFPKHMLIHIRGAQDVKSDGNCGFRAIGSLMAQMHQSLTFFPYETAPLDSIYRREISIGFVNHNHWIKVYLEGQHPMPPVDERWLRCATITASDWLTPYQNRIRQFRYEAGITDPYDNDPIFIE